MEQTGEKSKNETGSDSLKRRKKTPATFYNGRRNTMKGQPRMDDQEW